MTAATTTKGGANTESYGREGSTPRLHIDSAHAVATTMKCIRNTTTGEPVCESFVSYLDYIQTLGVFEPL